MTRPGEQVAQQVYIRRSSANNGLPYRQSQFYEQETEEYEDVLPSLYPRSAIKYTTTTAQPPVIKSGNRHYVVHQGVPTPQQTRRTTTPEEEDEPRPCRRVHWSLVFGIGMAAMLTL